MKTNVIPDVVDIDVDIRTLPGETAEDVSHHLRSALGRLADEVEVSPLHSLAATSSPTDTQMWFALERLANAAYPGSSLLPRITVGGTDAGWYRNRGAVAYGCGLMSPGVTYEMFANRFHGNDERIDVESLQLTTELWLGLAHDFLT